MSRFEQLFARALERRDSKQDLLENASASGSPIAAIRMTDTLSILNPLEVLRQISTLALSLILVIVIQVLVAVNLEWVLKWPGDGLFWAFVSIDVVLIALVLFVGIEAVTLQRRLDADVRKRPWHRLWDIEMELAGAGSCWQTYDKAMAELALLSSQYRTWVVPLKVLVSADWKRNGPQAVRENGNSALLARLLPEQLSTIAELVHVNVAAAAIAQDIRGRRSAVDDAQAAAKRLAAWKDRGPAPRPEAAAIAETRRKSGSHGRRLGQGGG